jgi:hypothetical protein
VCKSLTTMSTAGRDLPGRVREVFILQNYYRNVGIVLCRIYMYICLCKSMCIFKIKLCSWKGKFSFEKVHLQFKCKSGYLETSPFKAWSVLVTGSNINPTGNCEHQVIQNPHAWIADSEEKMGWITVYNYTKEIEVFRKLVSVFCFGFGSTGVWT